MTLFSKDSLTFSLVSFTESQEIKFFYSVLFSFLRIFPAPRSRFHLFQNILGFEIGTPKKIEKSLNI